MKAFFQSILIHKNIVLAFLVAISVILFSWVDKFRFDASSETLVLEDDLSYELYEKINERFSSSEFLVVALIDQRIFSPDNLNNLKNLESKLEQVVNVSNVISILDAPLFEQPKLSLVKSASNDKYLLLDDLDLNSAKKELIESPLFNQLIINNHGTAVAMQINLNDAQDYEITVKDIRNILKEDSHQELEHYDPMGHGYIPNIEKISSAYFQHVHSGGRMDHQEWAEANLNMNSYSNDDQRRRVLDALKKAEYSPAHRSPSGR